MRKIRNSILITSVMIIILIGGIVLGKGITGLAAFNVTKSNLILNLVLVLIGLFLLVGSFITLVLISEKRRI